MNLEHVQAVKARIEEIRRRFVDPAEAASRFEWEFGSVLRRVRSRPPTPCPEELDPVIAAASEKYSIPPAVIKSVIHVESGFRQGAVSRVGAQGLMQLMPGTAQALGVDPTDPEQNIEGGVRYLRQLLDRFGRLDLALAAYNAGPAGVIRYGGIPPYAETQRYVDDVMSNIENY